MHAMEHVFDMLFGFLAVVGGLAAVTVVGVVGALAWGARRAYYAIKGEEYKPLFGGDKTKHEYEHQDVDDGATADSVMRVLKRYTNAKVVGQRARAGITALENMDRKTDAFYAILEKKFQKGSLSWEKFAVAADLTHDALLRNCAALANRVQVFDRAGYHSQQRELGHRSSTWRARQEGSAIVDPAAAEKQQVLQQGLDEMDALLAANDRLLTELDKLTFELGKLTDADSGADGERIVEEIRTLIDETKYYSRQ